MLLHYITHFPSCKGKKTWWQLPSQCFWNSASLTCFRACFLPGRSKDLSVQENISVCNIHCWACDVFISVTAYLSKCFHGYCVQFPSCEADWSLRPHDNLQDCPFEALRAVIPRTAVQSVMHFPTLHAGTLILTEMGTSTAILTPFLEAKILQQCIKSWHIMVFAWSVWKSL